MIGQGLTLTIIGMSIVIVFLTILVGLMAMMSGIVRNFERKRALAASEEADESVGGISSVEAGKEAEEEDLSEIAAALGAYLKAGGVLPAPGGDGREDIAAVLAAVAAAGGPIFKGNYNEIAAAVSAIRAYK